MTITSVEYTYNIGQSGQSLLVPAPLGTRGGETGGKHALPDPNELADPIRGQIAGCDLASHRLLRDAEPASATSATLRNRSPGSGEARSFPAWPSCACSRFWGSSRRGGWAARGIVDGDAVARRRATIALSAGLISSRLRSWNKIKSGQPRARAQEVGHLRPKREQRVRMRSFRETI